MENSITVYLKIDTDSLDETRRKIEELKSETAEIIRIINSIDNEDVRSIARNEFENIMEHTVERLKRIGVKV